MRRNERASFRTLDPWIPPILFFAALIPRILNALTIHYRHYLSDSFQYVSIAQDLFSLNGFFETVCHFPPGYPLLIRLTFLLFGDENFVALRMVQSIFSALVPVCLYLVGKRLQGSVAGLVCALPALFFGPAIFYGSTLMSETLFVPQVAISMVMLLSVAKRSDPRRIGILSAFVAWAILTRPIFIAFIPALVGVLVCLVSRTKDRRETCRLLTAGILPFIVLMGSWSTRNWIAYSELVWVAPNTERNLWIGNSPNASGTYDGINQHPDLENLDSWDRRKVYRRLAMDSILEDPYRFLSLAGKKMRYLWGKRQPWPLYGTNSLRFQGDLTFPILPAWVIQLGAIAGLGIGLFRLRAVALISIGSILLYCSLIAMTFGLPRFRLPLDPILLLWFGLGIYWLLKPLGRRMAPSLKDHLPAILLMIPAVILILSMGYRMVVGGPTAARLIHPHTSTQTFIESPLLFDLKKVGPIQDARDAVIIDLTYRYEGGHSIGIGELGRISCRWFDARGEELKWWVNSEYWLYVPVEGRWIGDRIQIRIPENADELRVAFLDGSSDGRISLKEVSLFHGEENPIFLNQYLPRLRRFEYPSDFFP